MLNLKKRSNLGAHDTLIGVNFDVEKLIVGMLFHAQFRLDQSIGGVSKLS